MITLALGLIVLQTVPGPQVTAAWDANPPEQNVVAYHLIIDSTIYDVGNVTTYTVPKVDPGQHQASLTATNAIGNTSQPSAPVSFTVAPQSDPCAPPLGAHAPAIFPTSPTITTGKPGSRSFMNYQLAAPDPVVEVAIQIDDDDVAIGKGADLAAFSGMWFTQPIVGSHKIGVRVLTSFGCRLIRNASAPLVVKP